MSHHQDRPYGLGQGYYDQYGQFHPGFHNGEIYPGQRQYQQQLPAPPGAPLRDPQYQSGGGPVQQPVYVAQQSMRHPSLGGGYQPATYNPQNYAPPQQHSVTYNPQLYANTHGHGYNPATYAESPAYGFTAGPAESSANPNTYSPSTFIDHSPFSPAPQTSQGYSPHVTQPRSPPQPPSHSATYTQQYAPSPPPQSYGSQPPPPPGGPYLQRAAPYPMDVYSQHQSQVAASMRPQSHASTANALPGLYDEAGWTQSPPAFQASDGRGSLSPLQPTLSHTSQGAPSPPSSTSGPTPPAHGSLVSRHNTRDRHPQSRPLPGPPEPDFEPEYFHNRHSHGTHLTRAEEEALSQEELFTQVEHAVLAAGRSSSELGHHSPFISVSQAPHERAQPTPLFTRGSQRDVCSSRRGIAANGHRMSQSQDASDESDAEAEQGLAMMQAAEEEDARRLSGGSQARFSGYNSQRNSHRLATAQERGSDSEDYGTVDMSAFGGGYDVHMTYGGDPNATAGAVQVSPRDVNSDVHISHPVSSQHSSMRRSHASQSSQRSTGEYDYTMNSIHPFPPFNSAARVDASGTGGLSEPSGHGRRQSYDEGDEFLLLDSGQIPDRFPDEPPDISYQPALYPYSSSRPLPPPPSDLGLPQLYTDLRYLPGQGPYPLAPDAYHYRDEKGNWVPRSSSMVSQRPMPQVEQPLRAKTDAEERRKQLLRASGVYSQFDNTPATSVILDLPSLGGKRFAPNKLGAPDFKKCEEPWSLSGLLSWLLNVVGPEQYAELREADIRDALVALFTNKVPTMNIADAEVLSARVVHDMYDAGALVPTEEWVRLVPVVGLRGVIFQLTGTGCYSSTLHDHIMPGRCYSHHCQRTLKKVNLLTHPDRRGESWAEFYKLKKEDLEDKDKKELERQNVLHEIVQTEDVYMEQLNVLRLVYRDPLASIEPSVIGPKRKEKFLRDVFGRIDAVKQANEDHLLPQLKYRQQEQGPWIIGFSDIFRQWIRKAKPAYLEYAGSFPGATYLVRREVELNLDFNKFIELARNDKRGGRLGWDTYLKAPITRLQRLSLLLTTVLKNMRIPEGKVEDSQKAMVGFMEEEKRNLKIALEEVRAVTHECDARVGEMQRKVDLSDLGIKLVLRPGMQDHVELNLDHFGRELVHRGDLQRMGGNRFNWVDSHALLFDHYLVIAKTVAQRSDQGGKVEKYDVSRMPIPMDLLILESTNDPPVQKSNYVKGITSVTTVTGRTSVSADTALPRTQSGITQGPNGLQHANTGSSVNTLQTVNSLGQDGGKDSDRIMYSFKVKHLGRETYQLFAASEQARREWVSKIIEAKTKHAAALHAQNAEPFKLRVMADSAFYYDTPAAALGKIVIIKGTPVDRAIIEVDNRFKNTGRPSPICRARVNCATSFTTAFGGPGGVRQVIAIGTDYGVFMSDINNPRGWTKAIAMSRVTQIAVLEEFNLFLLICDKSLIAYHLDAVVSNERDSTPTSTDSARKAPQKLSGSKDVGFFVTGKMKDRTLVFYKKRENLNSVFKVLEPIYQKSTEKKRGMFKRGTTEFFREYDEFYIPAECAGMDLFHSSLAVSTAKGFEVLTLDKKQPWSVPDLRAQHVQNIASHLKDQRALGMLRLSDQEFLLCYTNCAVYVNKHGDVSRSVIMDFVGTAQSAALYGAYLILFDSDFVEIRNAQNGRLKQIIAGREIKCLDDGGNSSAGSTEKQASVMNGAANGTTSQARTVKLVMQHPEADRTQIVVELLLNEKMKE